MPEAVLMDDIGAGVDGNIIGLEHTFKDQGRKKGAQVNTLLNITESRSQRRVFP